MGEHKAVSFKDMLQAELAEIALLRAARGRTDKIPVKGDVLRRAHGAGLVGLAFSGGGIRSATFNLGVLQGLAKLKLLPVFDYLSTVSGGGYIGSWFTVWLRRRGWNTVTQALAPKPVEGEPRFSTPEPPEVSYLRDYSNYITPRKGMFSGDTWVVLTTYMRNLMLNLSILVLALAALLIVMRIGVWGYDKLSGVDEQFWRDMHPFMAALMIFAIGRVRWYLSTLFDESWETQSQQKSSSVLAVDVTVVLPIMIAAWLLAAALGFDVRHGVPSEIPPHVWASWALSTGVLYLGVWLCAWLIGLLADAYKSLRKAVTRDTSQAQRLTANTVNFVKEAASQVGHYTRQVTKVKFWAVMLSAFFAGALAGPLLLLLITLAVPWAARQGGIVHLASFAMPIIVLIFALCAVVHIGLAGRGFNEEAREWWSRLGAHLLLANSVYAVLFVLAFYSPQIIVDSEKWVGPLLASGWLGTSIAGLISGRSATPESSTGPVRKFVMAVAPTVFVVGLLIALAWGVHVVLPKVPSDPVCITYWCQVVEGVSFNTLYIAIACFVLSLLLSWRIGINDFSIHAFYGSRLVRAYLGASNPKRNAHPFTGFDPNDNDTRVSDLTVSAGKGYVGPYYIVNAAVNLTHGGRLAWQQRKASSFVFTPLYCGYDLARGDAGPSNGYCPNPEYAGGVSVGKAMAISGAAASPNMGYHSSATLAFLMTVFNVRLGWWMGNPMHARTWRNRGPKIGLFYLFCELFGLTNDKRGYVYLSDGGHFENLGVYELVRRRCRYILVCDAGEDHNLQFGDLGNAVERIRADFGVDIDVNVGKIRYTPDNLSSWHCAVGRIRYSAVDGTPESEDGRLLYIKSSVTGDEPVDVLAYRALYKEFPHQSTADQWFDEAQFESYRALGEYVIDKVLRGIVSGDRVVANKVFDAAAKQWCADPAR